MDPNRDKDQDEHSRPGLPRPGKQPGQQPHAPPFAPTTNPDLDPACSQQGQRIDPRQPNPLVPQGMLFDPRQLLDHRYPTNPGHPIDPSHPPGARFDPYGPPDIDLVVPGRHPPSTFGNPDPDHLPPPGVPQLPPMGGKNLPGRGPLGSRFQPPGGAGGSPFL